MITGKRINEFDVVVNGCSPKFIAALRKVGLKAHKLKDRVYQVSFDGFPELRKELPPVGETYIISD